MLGGENKKVYYYIANNGVDATTGTENAISFGEVNIDDMWKSQSNINDFGTVNKIVNNIIME
ncbi:hypothetical protein UAY_00252 [Enterococcus moraviensis ATCC BAA-383]|uniref:Uncharacterized protein n=1 Tax=Enterococcus moraviensis ATCC BAA-383 TaxID=1158609 RepID=R2RD13_9ENTE|nr:hypothetical protein [Enterococcus moraviensis]EOI06910.1 hypothetical protein UAY_00252 [Enterococcus moraviensis ATCC BAA-383]EOT65253.1 hypothetical protein I586_02987 [Enterococcus moraviensis ATCC BAA-383]OJG64557.1 hypothetical protein RV09_GL001839 [Enterococcus moraviensis]